VIYQTAYLVNMPKLPVTLRPATSEDMASVAEIHKHYVLNTVITFTMEPLSIEQHLENLKKVKGQNLPFIVAVSEESKVVGYSYLSGFRNYKQGYRHTVELSLFCHPDYLYQGIGSALLSMILDVAARPEENNQFKTGVREEDRRVRQIIACMSVNTDSKEEGLGSKRYYEGFGFVFNGHLKQVGHKLDRW
jgi:L-amino acid N-acyltransferase YncA